MSEPADDGTGMRVLHESSAERSGRAIAEELRLRQPAICRDFSKGKASFGKVRRILDNLLHLQQTSCCRTPLFSSSPAGRCMCFLISKAHHLNVPRCTMLRVGPRTTPSSHVPAVEALAFMLPQGTARWLSTGLLQAAAFRIITAKDYIAVVHTPWICMLVSVRGALTHAVSSLANWAGIDVYVYSAVAEGRPPGGSVLDLPRVRCRRAGMQNRTLRRSSHRSWGASDVPVGLTGMLLHP